MDKEFEKWLKDFDEGKEEIKRGDWSWFGGYDTNTKDLLSWYIQFKNGKETKSLVKATWFLALITMILAIATIWLALKA